MSPVASALVVLALLATSNALPVGTGILPGTSLAPNALNGWYNQEVILANQPVQYGFGFDKDGTFILGVRVVSKLGGKDFPISASFSVNMKDVKKFNFEVGARVFDSLAGVVYGDKNGLKWLSSLWVPMAAGRAVNSLGVSLEGDNLRPVAVAGGFGLNDHIYQGRIELDKNMKPSGSNFLVGSTQNLYSNFNQHKKQ